MARSATATYADRSTLVAIQGRGSNAAAPSETRARIIETAARWYRRIGHKKTTVADIAHDLSMSSANVYRFFQSKQAIEAAVAGELLNEATVAARDAAGRDGSASERLRTVLQTVERLHAFRGDDRLHELIVTATRENWPVVSSYADCLNSTLAQVISEGQASGEFSTGDPIIIARCVLGATSAYLDPELVSTSARSGRPALEKMIDFCIDALRVAPKETTAAR